MDKYRIIEWVINAVLVIVTTAVVTRLSLNQGKLGVTDKLKARFTPKFKAYTSLILSLLLLILTGLSLLASIMDTSLPSRLDVVLLVINTLGIFLWGAMVMFSLARITHLKKRQKDEPQ